MVKTKDRLTYLELKHRSLWGNQTNFLRGMQPVPCIAVPNRDKSDQQMQPAKRKITCKISFDMKHYTENHNFMC